MRFHPQVAMQNIYQGEGHFFDIGCRAKSEVECISAANAFDFLYSPSPKQRSRYPFYETARTRSSNKYDMFNAGKLQHFDEHKIIGEKSPNYFIESDIPLRIRQYNPRMKIVVLLCEPSARAFSDFVHFEANAQRQSQSTKLLGLVSTEPFRNSNESFAEFVDRSIKYLDQVDDLNQLVKTLGDLE